MDEKSNIFLQWIASWMDQHPPALSLQDANDTFTLAEIWHEYLVKTQFWENEDQNPHETLHKSLLDSGYIFEDGRFLTK